MTGLTSKFPPFDTIANTWGRFAANADPNGAPDVAWSPSVGAPEMHLVFYIPIRSGPGIRDAHCDIFDSWGG